jgi:hypothetical protein
MTKANPGRSVAMRRSALLLILLLVLPWLGCTKGQECDRCSSDDDCKSGSVCTTFSDGSKRCGTGVGATTCRVR